MIVTPKEYQFLKDLVNHSQTKNKIEGGSKLKLCSHLKYNNDQIRPYDYTIKRDVNQADYIIYNNFLLDDFFKQALINAIESQFLAGNVNIYNMTEYLQDHIASILSFMNNGYTIDKFRSICDIHCNNNTEVIESYDSCKLFEMDIKTESVNVLMYISSLDILNKKNMYYLSLYFSDVEFKKIKGRYLRSVSTSEGLDNEYSNNTYITQLFSNLNFSYFNKNSLMDSINLFNKKYNYIDKPYMKKLIIDEYKGHLSNYKNKNFFSERKIIIKWADILK